MDEPNGIEFRVPAVRTAPALARRTVVGILPPLPREVSENLLLLTSEVVTSAIRHGSTQPHPDVIVRVDADQRREDILVEVLSPGPAFDPPVPQPAVPRGMTTGLGLFLVDRLATRWGVAREEDRTKVWFEVSREVAA